MTFLRLDVDLDPLGDIAEMLAELDLEEVGQEAVEESSAVLLNRIRRRFLRQVDPEGIPWEPSKAAFFRSFGIGRDGKKLKRGAGGGTLFDTGTLYNSIQLYSISPLEMAIGTDVFYGVFHNEGTKTLPKREFLGFSDEDIDVAYGVLFSIIDKALQ